MKKILFLILLFASVTFITSCDTTSRTGASSSMDSRATQFSNSLADVLRKNTSLQVTGVGDDVKIYVRGVSTIKLETQPLYVVNGVPISNNYASVNNLLNPNDITSVRVLRNTSELTVWGESGTNGVILIETKQNIK